METGFTPTLARKPLEFRILRMKPRFHPQSPMNPSLRRGRGGVKDRLLMSD